MNDEIPNTNPQCAVPDPTPADSNPPPDEREQLIGAYQAQALKQPDPLRANLGVLAGDLMVVAYRARQCLDKVWAKNGPDRDYQLAHQAESILRFTRALGGLLRLQEKETEPPGPAR